MTTLIAPQAPADAPQGAGRAAAKGSRLARWRASWRVALRMARRDLRRHKGRSALVFLMVAVPVGLLACAATLGATEQADAGDLVTARMGAGQALVQGPQAGKLQQTPDPNQGGTGWSDDNPAVDIPGFVADGSATDNAAAVGRLVGGTAVAVGETQMRLVVGDRRVRISGLVTDPRVADLGAKARLSSGSWGNGPDEIVITPAGERKGLPRSGAVTLSAGGTERSVRVVGTATALLEWGGMPDFVVPTLPDGAGPDASGIGATASWVLVGGAPVTWDDVQRLNTYGLVVYSRAVLENPPPDSAIPADLRPQTSFAQDTSRMIAVIGGVMLFILTTLLVGPAFAVSAARQRRTLALAATNGAETRQLRRTVLAQALVLGVISAIGGVALGTLAVRVGLWWWVSTHPDSSFAAIGLDIPWGAFAILVPCAVLSAVTAALLPSLRLGRIDIIGVMRGQSVSPRLNKVVPVIGLVVAMIGGAVVLSAARLQSGGDFRIVVGAIALVLGTLLLVPAVMVAFGRVAARLPVAVRLATRDAARHRSRSTPTVAAILAGVVALTAFSIGLASDTKQQMATYQPQALPGEGTVFTGDTETQLSVAAALRKVGAGVRAIPLFVARGPEDPYGGPASPGPQQPVAFVAGVPGGCTVQKALDRSGPEGACGALGTLSYDSGQIGVLPAREIKARLRLTEAQGRVVDGGGIAVAVPALATTSTISIAHGTFVMDQTTYSPTDVVTTATADLPVVAVAPTVLHTGAMPAQTGAFVTPETARRLGWPTFQTMVLLHAPDGGAIGEATEKTLDELVGQDGGLHVERGFQRHDKVAMRIMMGVAALLLLIVTLVSTALAMAEQQADSGTLAAVGATRRTRRAFAAAQAMVVGFVGAVLGIAVGLVPGIAITYPLTVSYEYDAVTGADHVTGPFLAIPWTPLLLVVLGVPLLAGALSALAIRRAPAMTRRAD